MGVVGDLASAREAYERRDWAVAYERLSGAQSAGPLAGADLVRWGTAAFLLGRSDDAVRAFQRAHTAYLADGDLPAALRSGFWTGLVLALKGEWAMAGGWIARGWRLAEELPESAAERGFLMLPQAVQAAMAGNFETASATAAEVERIGRTCGEPDLVAGGLATHGRALIYLGEVQKGLSLMDEAIVAISAGEVSPIMAGMHYCSMIEACQELSEFARARQWTSALSRWCDTQPNLLPFTGQCAVHRGQLMRVEGAFDEAIEEFALARRRYEQAGEVYAAGLAIYERGEVLRAKGQHEQAEAAFTEASATGFEPQPGLALLWVEQGRGDAAVAALTRCLAEARDVVHRAHLLPAVVEARLAAGDIEGARAAAGELTEAAAATGCASTRARAAAARAAVTLAVGEAVESLAQAREALRLWDGIDAPIDAAKARVLVARALRDLGDDASAQLEAAAAARVFRDRGAAPDLATAEALMRTPAGPAPGPLPSGLTAREVEVLRLVARGLSNPQIARELYLSEKTVARHLSNIFGKIEVSSRTAAAAFAFEHQLL